MEILVSNASSSDSSKKKEALEGLFSEIRKNRGCLPIPNLSKFFSMLKERLQETEWDILSLSLSLTQEIIPVKPN